MILVEVDAEILLEQRGEAEARDVEQLRGEHRVEHAERAEIAELAQQAQVVVAAVHDEVLGGEAGPEFVQRQVGQHVDEDRFRRPTRICRRQTLVR